MSRRMRAMIVICGCFPIAGKAQTLEFPPVGVGFGETLRVNVHPPSPCIWDLLITLDDGSPVVNMNFNLATPTISTYPFDGNQVSPTLGSRIELLVSLTVSTPTTAASTCQPTGSVEILETATGLTSLVVAPIQIPPGPTQATYPVFGPAGMGTLQTARLNILAHPPNPCYGILSFQNAAGNPIGTSKVVTLSAGTADFLDLPSEMAGVGFFGHAEVQPVFTPTAGVASVCSGSVEVFDQLTGWSRTLVPPGPAQVAPGPPI